MSTETKRTRRKVRRCVGQLLPGAIYTREGAFRFAGLGSKALAEARQSGIVKPIYLGRRSYYRGEELIEWIESGGHKEG